jgi:DNA mismatch repair protein MutS2
MATTHMSALTGLKYEHEDKSFENASAEFDEATLSPTYRLLWGIPGRSNALNIAGRLGMPEGVVEQARALLGAARVRRWLSA